MTDGETVSSEGRVMTGEAHILAQRRNAEGAVSPAWGSCETKPIYAAGSLVVCPSGHLVETQHLVSLHGVTTSAADCAKQTQFAGSGSRD